MRSAVGVSGPAAPRPDEPVAVTGIARRFPAANDLPASRRRLESGANPATEGVPGSGVGHVGQLFADAATVHCACLTDIDQSDAEFFRSAPIEAGSPDPQPRLLLETSCRALEDSGLDPDRLSGTRGGVYVGIGAIDYTDLVQSDGQKTGTGANHQPVTGSRFGAAAGRVSFALGMEGPAVAVDTACSSSTPAVHHAAVSLQRSEADVVSAGGVNVLLASEATEAFSKGVRLCP